MQAVLCFGNYFRVQMILKSITGWELCMSRMLQRHKCCCLIPLPLLVHIFASLVSISLVNFLKVSILFPWFPVHRNSTRPVFLQRCSCWRFMNRGLFSHLLKMLFSRQWKVLKLKASLGRNITFLSHFLFFLRVEVGEPVY